MTAPSAMIPSYVAFGEHFGGQRQLKGAGHLQHFKARGPGLFERLTRPAISFSVMRQLKRAATIANQQTTRVEFPIR